MGVTNLDNVKVTLQWNAAGVGLAANVFNAQLSQTTPHTMSDGDLRTDMETWMEALLAPMETHIVVSYTVTGILIHKWVSPDWVYVTSGIPVINPTNGGDPLPSGVAALITVAGAVTRTRGRKYLPGMSETAQTAGAWVVGVLGALASVAVVWITPFASVDVGSVWYPHIWSTKNSIGVNFTPRVLISDIPAYQRRRKEGVGV